MPAQSTRSKRSTRSRALTTRARSISEGVLRILCVHGVGDHHTDLAWQGQWRDAIQAALARWDPTLRIECDFDMYDDVFEKPEYPLKAETYASALAKMTAGAVMVGVHDVEEKVGEVVSGIGSAIHDFFHPARGLADIPNEVRWTAGMVAQWSDYPQLRADCRARLTEKLQSAQYDVVLAHSLGTLVSYDTFTQDQSLPGTNTTLAVFGSQIGNPFIRGCFGGYLVPLVGVREWYQLYNPDDRVLTGPISIPSDPNFTRVETRFQEGLVNHDAVRYITHENAISSLWYDVTAKKSPSRAFAPISAALEAFGETLTPAARDRDRPVRGKFPPNRRALLVGINEYPDPQNRLEGCVNDVFLISAGLQESGFTPDDIRVVLDDRATTQGIMDRLTWLLNGTRDGDERVFFYSGHGAQIPGYDARFEVDHLNECLVPWDFDWSEAHAITDKQFVNLYSQLPYAAQFVAIFDCCHSGGMTREGGARIRGISPPDDVRHRVLRWEPREEMWVPRDFDPITPDKAALKPEFVGTSQAKYRLGRAVALRVLDNEDKKVQRKAIEHRVTTKARKDAPSVIESKGPYMPTIIEACQEEQLSYEYRHGVTSYGAFTFSMSKELRDMRHAGQAVTFERLLELTTKRLQRLKYDQLPCITVPKDRANEKIPWRSTTVPGAKTG